MYFLFPQLDGNEEEDEETEMMTADNDSSDDVQGQKTDSAEEEESVDQEETENKEDSIEREISSRDVFHSSDAGKENKLLPSILNTADEKTPETSDGVVSLQSENLSSLDKKSKDKAKQKKNKLSTVHPFFQRASQKLGDIKKKMAKLRQNLKDIQTQRAERQQKKEGSSTKQPDLSQVSSTAPSDGKPLPSVSTSRLSKQPQFIKLPTEAVPSSSCTEISESSVSRNVSEKNGRSSLVSRKRKHNSADNDSSQSSEIKRGKLSTNSVISTASGAMIVSDIETAPKIAGSGKRS